MSLHLNLTKNEELMSPWLTVERHENGTVRNEEPGSSVAVSNGPGLVSSIEMVYE